MSKALKCKSCGHTEFEVSVHTGYILNSDRKMLRQHPGTFGWGTMEDTDVVCLACGTNNKTPQLQALAAFCWDEEKIEEEE